MDKLDSVIKEESCNEFEFDKYSIVHNLTLEKWELHFYDEDEGELFTYIEDTSFDEESELFNKLGFTREVFDRLISFEESQKNAQD